MHRSASIDIYHVAASSFVSPLSSRLAPPIQQYRIHLSKNSRAHHIHSPSPTFLVLSPTMSGFAQLAQILADPEAYNMTYAQAFETVAEAIIVPSKAIYLGPHIMG